MKRERVETESDAEQKFIYRILTDGVPSGLGIEPNQILTKKNIKKLKIGKSRPEKRYHPDYIVVVNSVPVLIVEAKSPDKNVEDGLREARMYAHEINSKFESNVDPLRRVISSNYNHTLYGYWNESNELGSFQKEDANVVTKQFSNFVEFAKLETLEKISDELLDIHSLGNYYKPKEYLGGELVREQGMPENDFGDQLAWKYRNLFRAEDREGRRKVVQEAYVNSKQRDEHVKPIDRAIRAARPPSVQDTEPVNATEDDDSLVEGLRVATEETKKGIENHVLLLIGRAGCGKSTFVEYLKEVALPDDLDENTLWSHVNLNNVPVNRDRIYDWITEEVISRLKSKSDLDFDKLENIERLYNVEINKLKKGRLKRFEEGSEKYNEIIDDKLKELQSDRDKTLNAYFRFLGSQQGKAPIVVLDNADKGNAEEQLLLFEVARWLKQKFRCIVVLPIRDKTYNLYNDKAPLNTSTSELSFRIDAPPFKELIEKRIDLVADEIKKSERDELYYYTSNRMRVSYDEEEEVSFLKSIANSILRDDHFTEQLISGLAGKSLRDAIDIFLDFCTSGYISEDEITKMRLNEGEYTLPKKTTSKILFRGTNKFFDEEQSSVSNVYQRKRSISFSNHFVKLLVLRWLDERRDTEGPIPYEGFHRAEDIVDHLKSYGFDRNMVSDCIDDLIRSNCITPEHLNSELESLKDLLHISPAGRVHLSVLDNPYYLSAVVEDTFLTNENIASQVAARMPSIHDQHGEEKLIVNALDFSKYLLERKISFSEREDRLVPSSKRITSIQPRSIINKISNRLRSQSKGDGWNVFVNNYSEGDLLIGKVSSVVNDLGVFVTLVPGFDGLCYKDYLNSFDLSDFSEGDICKAKIHKIKRRDQNADIDILGILA
jgi:energy-coupling factor transporter ATP-binding protein EcfA2